MNLTVRPMEEGDRARVLAIVTQSFNLPKGLRDRMRSTPADQMRVAEERGIIVGCLRAMRFAHFLDGRAVEAVGIASVGVAPEARGRGVAEALVGETLRELHGLGVALSTLYPATVPLYRRCGYEYFATRARYRADLDALPRDSVLPCVPWDDTDVADVAGCYRAAAESANGPLDRPPWWWAEKILWAPDAPDVYRLAVREDGRVTGYIVYTQEPSSDASWGYDLACRDLVWTTPGAARALLTLAARHRSLGRNLIWHGPMSDPLALVLAEQEANLESTFRMMGRLVDLPAAVEGRGYRREARASVVVEVSDDLLAANDGRWRIEVADGHGTAEPTDAAATARIHIGTLAGIYSGMVSAREARRAGKLDSDDGAVASLEAIFSGPAPWLSDFF